MDEIWMDIKGLEGRYMVSSYGNVKSLITNKLMSPYKIGKGYLRIHLVRKDGKIVRKLIHRIVAENFLSDSYFEGAEVNHIDLDKKNNHVDNLEWTIGKDNVNHAIDNTEGRLEKMQKNMSKIGKKYYHIGVEKSKKPVAQIDRFTGEIIQTFESAREASRVTGANYKNISQVCRGEKKTHLGYVWKFV